MSICSGVAATAARSKKVVGGGGEAASKEVPRYLSIHIYTYLHISTHIYTYLPISTQVAKWIRDISDLHRAKPPPSVNYRQPMPDVDRLMQVGILAIPRVY